MVALEDLDPPVEELAKPIHDPKMVYPIGYALRTFSWLIHFHVLPKPGGLNGQDRAWVEEMERLFSMKAQVQREYKVWKDAQPK